MEDCPAQSATEDSGNGIPDGTKAVFLHCCSGNIAADGTAYRFNYQASDIHRLLFCLLILSDSKKWNTRRQRPRLGCFKPKLSSLARRYFLVGLIVGRPQRAFTA